jgi:hypothetical protein
VAATGARPGQLRRSRWTVLPFVAESAKEIQPIVTGRTTTTAMTIPWRIAVTLAIGAGLALPIVGLWHTLAAEVGANTRLYILEARTLTVRASRSRSQRLGAVASPQRRLAKVASSTKA